MTNTSKPPDQFVGTDGSFNNEIVWEPLDGSLPMKHVVKGSSKAGALVGCIGLVWAIFIGQYLLAALNTDAPVVEVLMLLLVVLPAIFCILFALSQFRYQHEFLLEYNKVTMVRQGLFGTKNWREPLSNYKGVLKQYQTREGPKSKQATGTVYIIRLVHEDTAKELILFQAWTRLMSAPEKWENAWRHYANILNVPLLEKTEEGIASFQPDQMEVPLRDKIHRGLLSVDPVNPAEASLSRMVEVTPDGDAWVFTFKQAWTLWKAVAGLLILAILFMVVYHLGFIDDKLVPYFVLLIPIVLVLIGLSFKRKVKYPEQLAIDQGAIWYRFWQKERGWDTRRMPIASIRDISVKAAPTHRGTRPEIVIEGDRDEIRLGWWLPRKYKIRVKNLLLSVIAQQNSAG